MKHCHECDSDVADNDIFCPYCGISIAGVTVETASIDDEAFSSTIVIPSNVSAPEPVAVGPESNNSGASPLFETVENITAEQMDMPDETVDTALPAGNLEDSSEIELTDESINIDTAPDFEISTELSEQDTLDYTDTMAGDLANETEASPAEESEGVEEPRIAERLIGSIGSISGRFSEDSVNEIADNEAKLDVGDDPEYEDSIEVIGLADDSESQSNSEIESEVSSIDHAEEAVTEGPEIEEPAAMIVEDPEPELEALVNVETDDDLIAAVPTPILLTNAVSESLVENADDTEFTDPVVADDPPVEPEQTEPIENDEHISDSDLVSTEFPRDRDAVDAGIDSPDETLDSTPLVAADIDGPSAIVKSEMPAHNVVEVALVSEPPVAVTGETLDHKTADTDDGLEPVEADGGTSPNIGSSDTDGRKSGLKPLVEGTVLNNRYDIVRKIGGGGMGAVYLANDRNLGGVQRAVKEMVQAHIEEEQQEKAIDDFKRESMILSSLDHPSIPTIYDYFFDAAESRFYLVMKYISGGDLAGKLRSTPEGRIDERTVTEWALQIIDVLDYLHNLPTTIVYRDLKPSNVMIDGNSGRIMLIDFGIARSINQNQEKGVTAVGTMGYAPPELFSGNVEPRSDIYSLGSTMFHLLTGADPQNNPLLIFDFQKNPRPRQINPQLSDQIERILMRSVEYNADARFASAAEMRSALAAHLDNLRAGQITYGVTEVPQSVSLSHQIVFCGFCGQRIVATDMFCAFCGSKQPLAQHGVHSEVYSRTVGTARLVIEGTSELNAPAYGLEKNENLVGRRDPMSNIFPEVDLSKYDPQTKISRRHAKIWRDGGSFLLEDLGSSNGTILLTNVSDTLRLLPHQPHPLASGDRIRIGDTTLHFIIG